jgi:hypothetical protein
MLIKRQQRKRWQQAPATASPQGIRKLPDMNALAGWNDPY